VLASLGLPNLHHRLHADPGAPAGATSAALVPPNSYIQGYRRAKMSQFQTTATKSWPSVIGAEQLVLVGEIGANWFRGLDPNLRFSGPGVYLPATAFGAALTAGGSVQPGGFLTSFSWGYRLAARLEYSNALMGGNLAPRYAWAHDVKGVGPNFNEGVKAQSIGLSWDYQRKWIVDAQFTMFSGGKTFCGTDSRRRLRVTPASRRAGARRQPAARTATSISCR
jgi:hypothetical protein